MSSSPPPAYSPSVDPRAVAGGLGALEQSLLEALPLIVWVSAPDGRLIYCNRRGYEFTGTGASGAPEGSGPAKFLHAEAAARVLAEWRAHLDAGEPWEFEVRLLRAADGAFVWHQARYFPVRDPDGTIVSWLGTAIDIDDVRRAREERGLQTAVIESSDDAIVTKTLDGIVTSWNRGAELLFGYRADEIVGHSITLLMLPEDRDEFDAIMLRLRRGERIDHFETRRRRKDGRIIDISLTISPVRNTVGRLIAASSIKRDITEQRRLDALLRASEARFRVMADAMPQLVWTSDSEGHSTYCNRRWHEYAGIAPETEFTSEHWRTLIHPDDAERVTATWREAIRLGQEFTLEYRLRRLPDGLYRRHLGRAVHVSDAEGHFVLWVGTATDIDDQKRAEDVLRSLAEALEERVSDRTRTLQDAVAELNAFTHTVSHDLRAPLRGMQGFAEALGEDHGDALGVEGLAQVARIVASAQHMDALISDLLELSQISQQDLHRGPINLSHVARAVLTDLRRSIEERGVQVDIEIPPDAPSVLGQGTTVFQVLHNLVANAIKFVPPERAPHVRIRSEEREPFVRVWVEDNGIGIAREYHESIFGIFVRLHRSEDFPGTGVGLAIVLKAVQRMGGHVGVESTPGLGSRFWFELPKA
jgi:PAS domain S-box-containing protein